MTCTHPPTDAWAYARHRRRNEEPCNESRIAWAAYMRHFRYRTGRVVRKLTPVKKGDQT